MHSTFLYGLYILIWPAITLVVLLVICGATYRDIKSQATKSRYCLNSLVIYKFCYHCLPKRLSGRVVMRRIKTQNADLSPNLLRMACISSFIKFYRGGEL